MTAAALWTDGAWWAGTTRVTTRPAAASTGHKLQSLTSAPAPVCCSQRCCVCLATLFRRTLLQTAFVN